MDVWREQLVWEGLCRLLGGTEDHKRNSALSTSKIQLICVSTIIPSKAGDCSLSYCVLQGSAGETKL